MTLVCTKREGAGSAPTHTTATIIGQQEIGIRRSFGATAGRVFVAVMMESVVATVAAGVLGLAAATFVGALAGLTPALVAVRVKVIDAIRY